MLPATLAATLELTGTTEIALPIVATAAAATAPIRPEGHP